MALKQLFSADWRLYKTVLHTWHRFVVNIGIRDIMRVPKISLVVNRGNSFQSLPDYSRMR